MRETERERRREVYSYPPPHLFPSNLYKLLNHFGNAKMYSVLSVKVILIIFFGGNGKTEREKERGGERGEDFYRR